MSNQPPGYTEALAAPLDARDTHNPNINVTNPQGETRRSSEMPPGGGAHLGRQTSNASTISTASSGGLPHVDGMDEEQRMELDDEMRELPEGWVRCFDPAQKHHFYVDTKTKRSTWLHPYDDPEYLRSLPDTHPAHPNSAQARAVRKQSEDEETTYRKMVEEREREEAQRGGNSRGESTHQAAAAAMAGGKGKDHHRNWFQKKKDQMVGTKEERAKDKEERRKQREEEKKRQLRIQQEYIMRRKELIERQMNDPNIRRYYASDPYAYSAPMSPYSRGGLSPYGYGYNGGYGRRYGYGPSPYGYGYGGYGGMGMGAPLLGGLAGGMLLGGVLGGF